jgi:hypothetical protein
MKQIQNHIIGPRPYRHYAIGETVLAVNPELNSEFELIIKSINDGIYQAAYSNHLINIMHWDVIQDADDVRLFAPIGLIAPGVVIRQLGQKTKIRIDGRLVDDPSELVMICANEYDWRDLEFFLINDWGKSWRKSS